MRIYNGKNSQVDLPLAGQTRVSIAPHSVSKDVMPSEEFLSLIATSYDKDEIALIVAGPYEVNMCAHIPAVVPLIVQSLDAAIERFNPLTEKKEEVIIDTKTEEVVTVDDEPVAEDEEEVVETAPDTEEEGEGDVLDDEPAAPAEETEKKPAKSAKKGRKKKG